MFETALSENQALDPGTADVLASLQNEARKNFPFTVDFYNQQSWANPQVLTQAAVSRFFEEQEQFQAQVVNNAANILTLAQLEIYKQNQLATRQMMKMQLNNMLQVGGGGSEEPFSIVDRFSSDASG